MADPFHPKPEGKRRARLPTIATHITILAFFSIALVLILHTPLTPPAQLSNTSVPPLTVLTMLFGDKNALIDAHLVAHNCALIAPTRHRFIVYTDNLTRSFCHACECRRFTPVNCHLSCADPNAPGCNHCEKLLFVRDAILHHGQFLFLDSDLVIVKDQFLDRLSYRAVVHDFFAGYGFAPTAQTEILNTNLNSGLFFMRRLPGLNYTEMLDMMQDMNTNSDQSVISHFVFRHYKNWDSLSRRWNCRLSYLRRTEFPVEECYTLHGRGDIPKLFGQLHKQLLTVDA